MGDLDSRKKVQVNLNGTNTQKQEFGRHSQIINESPQIKYLTQLRSIANGGGSDTEPSQHKKNNTGLPDQLKSGIENLGGFAMDDVKVHYNSSKPAQLQAHAYAQGTDIHLAPGQEKHLPHEAWHVVQQKQGRVKPTLQMKGIAINDDSALETEADVMGEKAMTRGTYAAIRHLPDRPLIGDNVSQRRSSTIGIPVVQRVKTLADLAQKGRRIDSLGTEYAANTNYIHIGANQTGDMYHVKAALALFSENFHVLIWGVPLADNGSPASKSAINSAAVIADYLAPNASVFFCDGGKPNASSPANNLANAFAGRMEQDGEAHGFLLDVGQATSLISMGLGGGHLADEKVIDGMANINKAWNRSFAEDLLDHGFKQGIRYVLVNYRNVSATPGGVHPEHDTGVVGFGQLMRIVKKTGAVPVPMGDPPFNSVGVGDATLQDYWTWDSTKGKGRNAEAGLIRFLAQNFDVIGAVGMRSGTMDLLSFVGIPILSIDEDPVLRPDFEEQPSWARTNKLESTYGSDRYGTIYLNRGPERVGSEYKGHPKGQFDPQNKGYLEEELSRRFEETKEDVRKASTWHETHPYGKEKAEQARRRVGHILKDAQNRKQNAEGIRRDFLILRQLSIVAESAYAQREYAGYDPSWDEVYASITQAEQALSQWEAELKHGT